MDLLETLNFHTGCLSAAAFRIIIIFPLVLSDFFDTNNFYPNVSKGELKQIHKEYDQ